MDPSIYILGSPMNGHVLCQKNLFIFGSLWDKFTSFLYLKGVLEHVRNFVGWPGKCWVDRWNGAERKKMMKTVSGHSKFKILFFGCGFTTLHQWIYSKTIFMHPKLHLQPARRYHLCRASSEYLRPRSSLGARVAKQMTPPTFNCLRGKLLPGPSKSCCSLCTGHCYMLFVDCWFTLVV